MPSLLHFMLWIGVSPLAAGKSPDSGPGGPAPSNAEVVAPRNTTIFDFMTSRTLRHTGSGRGRAHSADPKIGECGRRRCSAAELHRAPPPKGKNTCTKSFSAAAATSTTPSASSLTHPRLYTHRDSGIPQPPAAGATAGGEESAESTVASWICRGVQKSPLLFTVAQERDVQSRPL